MTNNGTPWTDKQLEFWENAFHRWNVKCGATRAGKTYQDYFNIFERIMAVKGLPGHVVLLGATKGTLQRNIIEPMQGIYGLSHVSDIKSDNSAMLFGEKCYCLGAEKITALNRVRGDSWKYLYGDEVAVWNAAVFDMAKSRLDKSYSKADLTCNPEFPEHWFYKFITSTNIDIYLQNYTIDDNPYNDPAFVQNLKNEYEGTVYYDRFILGKWVRAEGACFQSFGDKNKIRNPKQKAEIIKKLRYIEIGGDIGGSGSATVYNAIGYYFEKGLGLCAVALAEKYDSANLSTESILANFWNFHSMLEERFKEVPVSVGYIDSAEQLIIKSLKRPNKLRIMGSLKVEILTRIRLTDNLFSLGRFHIFDDCKHLIEAYHSAVWNMKNPTKEERLDDGTTNIDSLDATEYSLERHRNDFLR